MDCSSSSSDDEATVAVASVGPYMFEPVDCNVTVAEDEAAATVVTVRLQQSCSEWFVYSALIVV